MGHGVVREVLNAPLVGVLQETRRGRAFPYDDSPSAVPRGKSLAIGTVGNRVHGVLVPLQRVLEVAVKGVVDKHAVADADDHFGTRWA